MLKLKRLAFNLSYTTNTKALKSLFPYLDFRLKQSWQFVIDKLQSKLNNSLNLKIKYNKIISQWYEAGGNDDYYLKQCNKLQNEIKRLNNIVYFSGHRA